MPTCKIKIVISKTKDGYIGYPLGLEGVVVGEGNTYAEAVADTRSAVQFHVETFGKSVLRTADLPTEASIAEVEISA